MKKDRVRSITWLWGVILVFTGCASSPEVIMRSLPPREIPAANASIQEVSLQEAGVSDREDRIFLSRLSIKNRTGKTLHFGPQDVHVADASGTLLYRISERWLPKYYKTAFWGHPDVADRKAIPSFPSAEVKLGNAVYTAPPSTSSERDKVAVEMAELVEETFVHPQEDAPGTFLDKGPEVILGTLVKEVTLAPGDGVSGFVYFYRPAAARSPYPLQVVIDLQGEIHTFQFQELSSVQSHKRHPRS
jgi:hypothetical protein